MSSGVFDQVILKPTYSATEASNSHEIAHVATREDAEQTVQMRRLICVFIVCI